MSDTKKHVVIVGGGMAGALLARDLSKDIDSTKHSLTLITARPFLTHLPATTRMVTTDDGQLEDSALVPYDNLFYNGNGRLKVGRVTGVEAKDEINSGAVLLANGERVPYDILVLAPGYMWAGPLDFPESKEDVLAHIKAWREKFNAAKNVVFVGGGPVGIEFAGELRDFFPDKTATIVQRDNLLLNNLFPDKFRKFVEADMRAAGAELILGDSLDMTEAKGSVSITTRSGKTLGDVDLIVPTYGGKPATQFLQSMGNDVLSSTGHIYVTKTLQLPSYPNVFAMGDAIESSESRQIIQVFGHVPVVAANVRFLLKDQAVTKEYKGSVKAIGISNGRYRGVMYVGILWGIMVGNWLVSWLKGKDLGVPKARKQFGARA